MKNRIEITAAEFCSSVRDGTHDSPKKVLDGGKPLVTTKHLKNGSLDISSTYNISNEDFEKVNLRSKVDKWDVLISMIGTVGEVFLVSDEPNYAIKNLGLFKVGNELNSKWLFYYLKSQHGQNQIKLSLQGSTQQYISLKSLRNLLIYIPETEKETKSIVSFLSLLDKKIELNQKMNETLDEIAKMLFKSWFIDFDPVRAKAERRPTGLSKEISNLFPDSFEDSEIGEIPKGWHTTSLDHITSKFTTGLNPRKNFVLGSGINFYVTIKNLGDFEVVLDDKCDKVDNDAIKKINSRSDLKENDILFSGIGTIGKVVYVFDSAKNWNISESVFSLRANSGVTFPSFLYQLLKSYPLQGYVQALAGGSVQRGIRMGALKEYKFSLPNFEVQQLFNETISPMIKKISLNLNETKSLINIRDTLLPNLISGELKIEDAKNLIEEAGV